MFLRVHHADDELSTGSALSSTSAGYADALVSIVGHEVVLAEASAELIEIRFANGAGIVVSLADSERRAAEAATLSLDGSAIWSW